METAYFPNDWTNLEEVLAYAKGLGEGKHVVYKRIDRNNYNVTRIEREDIWNTQFTEEVHKV